MINKKLSFFILMLLVVLLGITLMIWTKKQPTPQASEKIKVVATLFPTYDFTKQIGGDKIEVSLLLPPGVESHAFEPTPKDIIDISQADIFVYTGDGMEPWVSDVLKGINNDKLIVVNAGQRAIMIAGSSEEHEEEHESGDEHDDHTGLDPHIWLDLGNASIMVDEIAKALIGADSANAEFYQTKADNYKKQLMDLDQRFERELSVCATSKFIHGGHYAFGYLANRYSLSYVSAQGFNPDSEPTASQLISLSKQISTLGIKHVFYEELVDPKIARILSQETGAQLLLLNGAHNLSKQDFDSGITFLQIMENNLTNLKMGLQCQ